MIWNIVIIVCYSVVYSRRSPTVSVIGRARRMFGLWSGEWVFVFRLFFPVVCVSQYICPNGSDVSSLVDRLFGWTRQKFICMCIYIFFWKRMYTILSGVGPVIFNFAFIIVEILNFTGKCWISFLQSVSFPYWNANLRGNIKKIISRTVTK